MEENSEQKQKDIELLKTKLFELIDDDFNDIKISRYVDTEKLLTEEEVLSIYEKPDLAIEANNKLNWLINISCFKFSDKNNENKNEKNEIIFDKEKKEIILKSDIDNSSYNKKDDIIVSYKDFFTTRMFDNIIYNLAIKKSPDNDSQEDMNYLIVIANIIKFYREINESNKQTITTEYTIWYLNWRKIEIMGYDDQGERNGSDGTIIGNINERKELIKAFILAGDIEIVRYFIQNGIDITTIPNVDKFVFASGNSDLIHYYEEKLSVDRPEYLMATNDALEGACMSNNVDIVEYLFNCYDTNQINNIYNLIKVFSVIRNPRMAYVVFDRLKKLGYDINERYYNRKTIFQYAIKNNHFEVIQFLLVMLKKEENEFLVDTEENIFKCSIEYDCPEILDFLLKTCDKSLKGNFSKKFKDLLTYSLANWRNVKIVEILFNHFTFEENELLEVFSKLLRCGNLKKTELLLKEFFKKKYDVNKKDDSGKTLLHYAIENSNVELVKKLLNNNKLNLESDLLNKLSLLEVAIEVGNIEIIKLLLNKMKNKEGLIKEYKNELLPVAVKNDDFSMVKTLLFQEGIDVNVKSINKSSSVYGETPLYLAVSNNNLDMIKLLLDREDIDVNFKIISYYDSRSHRETLLHLAVRNNNPNIVELLLNRKDVDVNAKSDEKTPLYMAIKDNNLDMAKLLLARKDIKINTEFEFYYNSTGCYETLLHLAVRNNNSDMVKLLLTREDIDINAKSRLYESNHDYENSRRKIEGETPLLLAVKEKKNEVVKILLETIKNNDIKEEDKNELLSIAVENNDLNMIKLLLAREDINVNTIVEYEDIKYSNICGSYKETFRETLLYKFVKDNNLDMIEFLFTREGIDVNIKCGFEDETPLHLAVKTGKYGIAETLLSKMENIDLTEEDKNELLPIVIEEVNEIGSSIVIVRLLLERKDINIYAKSKNGKTTLRLAVEERDTEIVRILLYRMEDMELTEKDKKELLSIAAKNNDLDIVKLLLTRKDIDINAKSEDRKTPVYIAIENNYFDIFNFLVSQKDFDINIKSKNKQSKNGETLLHLAVKKNNAIIVKTLLSKMKNIKLIEKDKNELLLIAVKNNNSGMVNLLLTREDINIYTKSENGKTTLRLAVEKNNIKIVRTLLPRMKDMKLTEEDKNELLPVAIENDDSDIVNLLLTREDINIYTKSENGKTTLRLAVEKNNIKIVRILLYRMKDMELTQEDKNELLLIAVKNNNLDMVELLLTREDININTEFEIKEETRGRRFLRRGRMSNLTKNKDQSTKTTALGIAVKNKNKEIVELLIPFILEKKIKIDKNLKDEVCDLLGREIEIEVKEDKEEIKEQSKEIQKITKKKLFKPRKKPKKQLIDSDDEEEEIVEKRKKPRKPVVESDDEEEDLDIDKTAEKLAESINNNILSNGEEISDSLSDSEDKKIGPNK